MSAMSQCDAVTHRTSARRAPLLQLQQQKGQRVSDDQAPCADPLLELREMHRRRQDFHRAELRLNNQIKAIHRRLGHRVLETHGPSADADDDWSTKPLKHARQILKQHRLLVERPCRAMARQLPIWPWVKAIRGFGDLGLAQIVGEAGDLNLYVNPAKLWKRMGLAVIDGRAQRRVGGAAALEHGYSAKRRAIMYCIGASLLKKQNAYRELYLMRRQHETERALTEGLMIRSKKRGDPRDHDPPGIRTKLCIHRRAQRYMEKRLLRDLWRVWTTSGMSSTRDLSTPSSE